MHSKIININKVDNYKIIAISDVHGHVDHLKNLISKVNLKEDDYLIIIGDFINRGPQSYETFKYIQQLSKRSNTIILKGNHEAFIYEFITDAKRSSRLLNFLQKGYYETLINDLVGLSDLDLNHCSSGENLHKHITHNYSDILNFINELPTLVEFDEFIFVHGGYDSNFDINKDENKFLKYDNYNALSPINEKNIVVGHWPTSNLRKYSFSNLPIFNNKKNIISIDGGVGVKSSGELNALIIEKNNGKIKYDCIQENNFKKVTIKKEHNFEPENITLINYPNFDIEIIEKGPILSLCKHLHSNKLLSVFNCLIEKQRNKTLLSTTYINNFLNLSIGTSVDLCAKYDDCALVKYQDEFGWVMSYQL